MTTYNVKFTEEGLKEFFEDQTISNFKVCNDKIIFELHDNENDKVFNVSICGKDFDIIIKNED